MPAESRNGTGEEMLTRTPGRLLAGTGSVDASGPLWPWTYRVAGPRSSWPAVEVYEAGSLLDVVSSTMLSAQVLRGARSVRVAGRRRVLAWGRLPLTAGLPAVEFSRSRRRAPGQPVTPVSVTAWCWLAVADGRYDTVTVSAGGTAIRRRLREGRS